MTTMEYAAEYAEAQLEHMRVLQRARQHGPYIHSQLHNDTEEAQRDYCNLIDHYGLNEGDNITEEDVDDFVRDHPVCVDRQVTYDVWLTFGGPNAWVRVTTVKGVVVGMRYEFFWGSDSQRTHRITPDDPAWEYVESLLPEEPQWAE